MKKFLLQRLSLCLTGLCGLLMVTAPAWGQGFSVYEQGTCVMGRAGATVAETCEDGSGIFFNPAGLADMEDWTVSAGVTVIAAQGSFTSDRTGEETELQNDPIPVPHVYGVYGINDKLSAGLGLYVPYGLGTVWPREFEGAFVGYDNSLESIYVQPTVAYEVTEGLSIGAGLTVVIGSVKLTQLVDLSSQEVPSPPAPQPGITFGQLGVPFHTAFANATLEAGGAMGFGGNFGVQFQALDWLRLGARFLTNVPLEYEGEVDFEQVETGIILPAQNPYGVPPGTKLDDLVASSFVEGPLVDQTVRTEITMPAQLVLGTAIDASDALTLFFDYQWTNWSVFDSIGLEFENPELSSTRYENFNDTHGFRLGAEYTLNDAWALRAGFLTHTSAAPDETVTPLLPEAHRNQVTLGLGWKASDLFELNVAYQYIQQNDRRGRVREIPESVENPAEDPEALNSGLYSFNAHLFAATITARF